MGPSGYLSRFFFLVFFSNVVFPWPNDADDSAVTTVTADPV